MIEIVVFLNQDYSKSKSIWVNSESSKDEITQIVDNTFDTWWYYDIIQTIEA